MKLLRDADLKEVEITSLKCRQRTFGTCYHRRVVASLEIAKVTENILIKRYWKDQGNVTSPYYPNAAAMDAGKAL